MRALVQTVSYAPTAATAILSSVGSSNVPEGLLIKATHASHGLWISTEPSFTAATAYNIANGEQVSIFLHVGETLYVSSDDASTFQDSEITLLATQGGAPDTPSAGGGGGSGDPDQDLTWNAGTSTVEISGAGTTDATITAADATNPGLMVSADKTKLDGIETAATADQTAAEILAALLTVDGTGSLLDADLLDGNEAAFFATSSLAPVSVSATPYSPSWSTIARRLVRWTGSGTATMNLPAAADASGEWFEIRNTRTGQVTLDPSGAETIDGQSTRTVRPSGGSFRVWSDGTSWYTVGRQLAATTSNFGTLKLTTSANIDTGTATDEAMTPATWAGSADKTKLDGIETAATADQAWGDITGTRQNQTDLPQVNRDGTQTWADFAGDPDLTNQNEGDLEITTGGRDTWVYSENDSKWIQLTGAIQTAEVFGDAVVNAIDNTTLPGGQLWYRWGSGLRFMLANTQEIAYDNESGGPFALNEQITGGTSGSTAYIQKIVDEGTTGVLTVDRMDGDFSDNEEITGGTSSATADVDGAVTRDATWVGDYLPGPAVPLGTDYFLSGSLEGYAVPMAHVPTNDVQALTAQEVVLTPFYVPVKLTIEEAIWRISTASTTDTTAELGIVSLDDPAGSQWPAGADMAEIYRSTGEDFTSTGNIVKSGLALSIPAGWYASWVFWDGTGSPVAQVRKGTVLHGPVTHTSSSNIGTEIWEASATHTNMATANYPTNTIRKSSGASPFQLALFKWTVD